jgi:hypothetical protein
MLQKHTAKSAQGGQGTLIGKGHIGKELKTNEATESNSVPMFHVHVSNSYIRIWIKSGKIVVRTCSKINWIGSFPPIGITKIASIYHQNRVSGITCSPMGFPYGEEVLDNTN